MWPNFFYRLPWLWESFVFKICLAKQLFFQKLFSSSETFKNWYILIFLWLLLNNGINFTQKCFIILESYCIKENYGRGYGSFEWTDMMLICFISEWANVVNYIWHCVKCRWTWTLTNTMILSVPKCILRVPKSLKRSSPILVDIFEGLQSMKVVWLTIS